MYIAIRKLIEQEGTVAYSFGISDDKMGRVEIDKSTGNVRLIVESADDPSSRLFARVAHKLRQHWDKGEYPAATCWAS